MAGNLAARHGIAVDLEHTHGARGVTAVVTLPAALRAQHQQPERAAIGGPWGALPGAGGQSSQGRGGPARPAGWETTAPPHSPSGAGAYARSN